MIVTSAAVNSQKALDVEMGATFVNIYAFYYVLHFVHDCFLIIYDVHTCMHLHQTGRSEIASQSIRVHVIYLYVCVCACACMGGECVTCVHACECVGACTSHVGGRI